MLSEYQQFFTGRPTTEIAQDLLGKLVVYDGPDGMTGGYIVETEAYLGENDSASHAFNGRRTGYSESLYGQPGDIYLYQPVAFYVIVFCGRLSHGSVFWQHYYAGMVCADAYLVLSAYHAVRFYSTEF